MPANSLPHGADPPLSQPGVVLVYPRVMLGSGDHVDPHTEPVDVRRRLEPGNPEGIEQLGVISRVLSWEEGLSRAAVVGGSALRDCGVWGVGGCHRDSGRETLLDSQIPNGILRVADIAPKLF